MDVPNSFGDYVSRLTPDQCREQLRLMYEMMGRCILTLQGKDVPPVDLIDDERQTALELYYRCKKLACEKTYLEFISDNMAQEIVQNRMKQNGNNPDFYVFYLE